MDPTVEDHPQPRRMARYLLENVDYDTLAAPLSSELIAAKPVVAASSKGSSDTIMGVPRNTVMIVVFVVVLLIIVAATVIRCSRRCHCRTG